jgi:hypothetical protein
MAEGEGVRAGDEGGGIAGKGGASQGRKCEQGMLDRAGELRERVRGCQGYELRMLGREES